MYDPTLKLELRLTVRDVCKAMREKKRAADETVRDFDRCSRQSRKTLATTYATLDRLNRSVNERHRA